MSEHYKTLGQDEGRSIPEPPEPAPFTQEQLTQIQQNVRPQVGGGSSVTNITGPTQAEMIKAFQDAQDTSGIMGAIGTPTAGVDTPATGPVSYTHLRAHET